jgi:hypothetical protein
MGVFLCLFLGCVKSEPSSDCESVAEGAERDACRYRAIAALSEGHALEVLRHADRIRDPIIRGAALMSWVEKHRANIPTEDGTLVCARLVPLERETCVRRLQSAHLQR